MKEITIKLNKNSHPNFEIIAAKAADLDLIVFCRFDNHDWIEIKGDYSECFTFLSEYEYFLCIPKHKKECLHWLNGGYIQFKSEFGWIDNHIIDEDIEWTSDCGFMREDYEFRIKAKKEKRWIAFNKHTGDVYGPYLTKEYCDKAWSSLQIFEIEVEVTQ